MGPLRRHLRLIAAAATAGAVVGSGVLAAVLSADAQPSRGAQALRLALVGSQAEGRARAAGVKGGLTRDYKRGSRVTAKASATASAMFGQPTIAGIGGWGFEVDLRLDPSNASRIYMSAPDSASADS